MRAAYSTGMMMPPDKESVKWQRNVAHEQLYVDDVKRHDNDDVRRTYKFWRGITYLSSSFVTTSRRPSATPRM